MEAGGAAVAEVGMGVDRPCATPRRRRSLSAPRARQRCGQPYSQPDAASVAAPAGRREMAWAIDELAPCRAAVPHGSRVTTPLAPVDRMHGCMEALPHPFRPPPSRTRSRKRPSSPSAMLPSCVSSGGGSGGRSRPSTVPLAPVAQPLVRRARSPWSLPPMLQPLPPPRGESWGGGGCGAEVGADRPGAAPRRRRSLSAPRARQSGGVGGQCSRPRTPHDEESSTAQYRLPPPPPLCARLSSGGADGSRRADAGLHTHTPIAIPSDK